MANNIGEQYNSTLIELTARAFGEKRRIIVENGIDLPTDLIIGYALVIESITGFSCVDTYLSPLGGTYPTDLPLGLELPGGLKNISVTTGKLLCFLKN